MDAVVVTVGHIVPPSKVVISSGPIPVISGSFVSDSARRTNFSCGLAADCCLDRFGYCEQNGRNELGGDEKRKRKKKEKKRQRRVEKVCYERHNYVNFHSLLSVVSVFVILQSSAGEGELVWYWCFA